MTALMAPAPTQKKQNPVEDDLFRKEKECHNLANQHSTPYYLTVAQMHSFIRMGETVHVEISSGTLDCIK